MANVEHNILTTTELHEPKGIETAPIGHVYAANGDGGGTWSFGGRWGWYTYLTTLATATEQTIVAPFSCRILAGYLVIDAAVTGTSETVYLTAKVVGNVNAQAEYNYQLLFFGVVAAGSAAGSVFTGINDGVMTLPTTNILEGDQIILRNNGALTTGANARITLVCGPTSKDIG